MSSPEPQLHGTFTLGISDGQLPVWPNTKREPENKVNLTCPLVDFRERVFQGVSHGDYSAEAAFMKTHGFTAVKHVSSITDTKDFYNPYRMQVVYHREVEQLVKQVTGCKNVVVINSNCRGEPPSSPGPDNSVINEASPAQQQDEDATTAETRHFPKITPPIRAPHCDFTTLGGRQAIRSDVPGLRDAAESAGIIEREDATCAFAGIAADEIQGRKLVEGGYNNHAAGELGPRYAGFSIWRPIAPVTRDPLALVPLSAVRQTPGLVLEYYDNRITQTKKGWIMDYVQVEVRPDAVEQIADAGSDASRLKWYYISNMQPDEVLFVKFFDTAALGSGATEETGSIHASPDLGDAGYGDIRRSIEVRCMAFW